MAAGSREVSQQPSGLQHRRRRRSGRWQGLCIAAAWSEPPGPADDPDGLNAALIWQLSQQDPAPAAPGAAGAPGDGPLHRLPPPLEVATGGDGSDSGGEYGGYDDDVSGGGRRQAGGGPDARARFFRLSRTAERVLESYDIRRDVDRAPNVLARWRLEEQVDGGAGVGPSLTAQAAAAERMERTPRQEAPSEPPSVLLEIPARPNGAAAAPPGVPGAEPVTGPPPLVDDARWSRKLRSHEAFAEYMRELRAVQAAPSKRTQQLVYQIGIAEDWLQLSMMLDVMGDEVGPVVTAAMFKRLAVLCTAKALALQSPSERRRYAGFLSGLCTHARGLAAACSPPQAASILYGMGALSVEDRPLCGTLVDAVSPHLSNGAAAARAARGGGSHSGGLTALTAGGGGGGGVRAWAPAAAAPAVLSAAEAASLMWGLGTTGFRPEDSWLDDMAECCYPLLPELQPSQLWGILWGFARLRFLPGDAWMSLWLARAREALPDCSAEALGHMAWSLGALQYVPQRLWLRAFAGTAASKARSFLAPQLTQLLSGLAALGYCPRPQLCLLLTNQLRKQLHTLHPRQLAAVLHALGSYGGRWKPGRRFMFDFVTQSRGKMVHWTAEEAANVLWSFAKLGYPPEDQYTSALLSHIGARLQSCGPDALCQALWAAGKLRHPRPPEEWLRAWVAAAEPHAAQLSPQALAAAASGLAAAGAAPGARFLTALTRRASGVLGAFSCAELTELIGALADLRWRPSDAWLQVFARQVEEQLPAFENEDWGLLLYGLASMGQPLAPSFLSRLSTAAGRRLHGVGGEGLGLLAWGLAQYGGPLPLVVPDEAGALAAAGPDGDNRLQRQQSGRKVPQQQLEALQRRRQEKLQAWWGAFYSECCLKWDSMEARGAALMLLGLGTLDEAGELPLPPGEWQAGLLGALRRLLGARHRSWASLLAALRGAAGMDRDEQLPAESLWFTGIVLEWGRRCGLEVPPEGMSQLLTASAHAQLDEGRGDVQQWLSWQGAVLPV